MDFLNVGPGYSMNIGKPRIAVIGLGYVGLPLAIAFAKHFPVVGFDIDMQRIAQLQKGFDRTLEVDEAELQKTSLFLTHDIQDLKDQEVLIVTVPTPVIGSKPDLEPLRKASILLGSILKKGQIVVFESTVYPGVTENICGPLLEEHSGLQSGKGFFLGYSPERMNPGDRHHGVEKIIKVVAGQTPKVAEFLRTLYGTITGGKIFVAASIAVAEAAKVIENAQRDINVAFVNEVSLVMGRLDISMHDVLEAASTKWNFLPFQPGFVGGHCIGVDPYYLASCAEQVGMTPKVILSGRAVNEAMGKEIAALIRNRWEESSPKKTAHGPLPRILVLGLTFKENIPDLRNTKVIDFIHALKDSFQIDVHDAFADPQEAHALYGIQLVSTLQPDLPYDMVIGAVAHKPYGALRVEDMQRLLMPEGFIADIKGMWRHSLRFGPFSYWTL